jgi:hypothetical protein
LAKAANLWSQEQSFRCIDPVNFCSGIIPRGNTYGRRLEDVQKTGGDDPYRMAWRYPPAPGDLSAAKQENVVTRLSGEAMTSQELVTLTRKSFKKKQPASNGGDFQP